jgi:tRNA threonylcarbamoyl adenosine modification protein (Sua5/YciO/YrdC/YwlC family)
MDTKIYKIDPVQTQTDILHQAASIVENGGLVAFPTETVYGLACRVRTDSLAKLNEVKQRACEKYYTLHIPKPSDVKRFVPTTGLRAEKLIKKLWPGPVTLILELTDEDYAKQQTQFEKDVFENLYSRKTIGIRCPDHTVAQNLLELIHFPVVAPSANITDESAPIDANQVFERLAGKIELVLDAGITKYQKSSSVVKIDKNELKILREGVYSGRYLKELSTIQFLFVCTGNTCRSPMATGLFKKFLAEKLDCNVDRLEQKGYKIVSAGTMGITGSSATAEAIAACSRKGVAINSHISTALSSELIDESDLIFAMGRMHIERILQLSPDAAAKCLLLDKMLDIPDPIGQTQQVYDICSDLIEKAVKDRLAELVL